VKQGFCGGSASRSRPSGSPPRDVGRSSSHQTLFTSDPLDAKRRAGPGGPVMSASLTGPSAAPTWRYTRKQCVDPLVRICFVPFFGRLFGPRPVSLPRNSDFASTARRTTARTTSAAIELLPAARLLRAGAFSRPTRPAPRLKLGSNTEVFFFGWWGRKKMPHRSARRVTHDTSLTSPAPPRYRSKRGGLDRRPPRLRPR